MMQKNVAMQNFWIPSIISSEAIFHPTRYACYTIIYYILPTTAASNAKEYQKNVVSCIVTNLSAKLSNILHEQKHRSGVFSSSVILSNWSFITLVALAIVC